MMYLGDYANNATIDVKWSTNDKNGASITRATDGQVRVYKGNSMVQTTAGITNTEDADSLTGIHHCRIVLTDAFYETGQDYSVVLQGATIDGESVNAVIAHFSIENRYNPAGAGGGDATAANQTSILSDLTTLLSRLTAGRATNLDNLDTAVSTRLATASYTAPDNATLNDVEGHTFFLETLLQELVAGTTPNRQYTVAALANAPAGGGGGGGDATAANQTSMIADLTTLISRLTAARATNLDNLDTAVSTRSNHDDPDPNGYIDAAISGVSTGGVSAADIADAVWDEATSGHQTAGTFGLALNSIPSAAPGAIEVADITINDGSNPIEGAELWITTDIAGNNTIWSGVTNASGQPKDAQDNNPFLDAGTYYIWVQIGGYTPPALPITKIVS